MNKDLQIEKNIYFFYLLSPEAQNKIDEIDNINHIRQ